MAAAAASCRTVLGFRTDYACCSRKKFPRTNSFYWRRLTAAPRAWVSFAHHQPRPQPDVSLSAPRCWRRMKRLLPLVLAATLAWDASAVPAVSGNSTECNKCCVALASACGATCHDMACTFKCATCAGEHQQQLHQAGCSDDDIKAWCTGEPAPPPPTPHIPPVSRSAVL